MSAKNYKTLVILFLSFLFTPEIMAQFSVTDDTGNNVTLYRPAKRIISLAPHITELLFAAGAGDSIVGAVNYSNYPPAANDITRVGDTFNLDIEKIVSLNPDLVVIWHSGSGSTSLVKLKNLKFKLYVSEPRNLNDIATSITNLGILTSNETTAELNRNIFQTRLDKLKNRFADRKKVRVFYQIWHAPIFTINGEHIISKVINLCGGINVFSELDSISPQVGVESVIKANPEVIIASGMSELQPDEKSDVQPEWMQQWHSWPMIDAVRNGHIYFISPEIIQRQAPRILDGTEKICEYLDSARQ